MKKNLDHIRMLADVMNYLDRTYCCGSIVEWVRTSPEGAAYSIVRRLFIEVIEESSAAGSLLQAA